MIIDKLSTFTTITTGDSVAAVPSTALIGSQIDLKAAGLDIGVGEPIWLTIRTVTEIITAGSAGTIYFKVASDDTASISTTTSSIHLVTPTYTTDDAAVNSAELNAGGIIYSGPLPSDSYERYLGILCTIVTTEVTAGAIEAFLSVGPLTAPKAYPDGIA